MIILSAIKKGNKIYIGKRHPNIINYGGFKNCIQGFLNDSGEFLTREEAYKEAMECGQITKIIGSVLTSEDLW